MTSPGPRHILAVLKVPDVVDVFAVTGGAGAELYQVVTATARYALRVLPPGQSRPAERENRFLDHATSHGIPGPRVEVSRVVDDHPVSLLTWVDGQPLMTALVGDGDVEALGQQFGALLRQVHGLPVPDDMAASVPWRQVLPRDLVDSLEHEPALPAAVLHLDFHPLNLLERAGQVVAVLDWANADIGDPRFDLARTLAILTHAPLADPATAERVAAFATSMLLAYGVEAVPPVFRWWAGVTMTADLTAKVGHPSLPWLTDGWFRRVRRWTADARQEALHAVGE